MLNMTHRETPVTRAYSTQITHRTGPHIGRVDDYVRALQAIDISSCERDMLRAHVKAPGREITGDQLAKTIGHFGSRIGNRKYGKLAHKIAVAAELPMCKSDVSDYLAAVFTLADGEQQNSEDWHWVMHDEVAKALKKARIF
ncbi:hypothetical protein [Thalassospira alkalitolerans]|uniref:Uncharacterized protein n=1 Tax=Thalassospira alkalitolerans TaxID=1293890 RepID=A0A1Y2L9L4_9PROT|nr:hypothetical protein [Thalassospira alkalitolerans]OSQ47135.1 hypothetical protein TALK_14090 [Thalassospira alkalitolerans]|tara:strand:- start:6057 stop:6482 length:426 start_codon:yes stop_codon:yes gene_type:complete